MRVVHPVCCGLDVHKENRVHKILEDTNIKLSSVVSDLFGKSARDMLAALIAGQRDSDKLAKLVRGKLKRKVAQLELALQGHFTDHHGAIIQMALEQSDLLDRQIAEIDRRIAELSGPETSVGRAVEQLTSIPGVDTTAGRAIVAEISTEPSRSGWRRGRGCVPATTKARAHARAVEPARATAGCGAFSTNAPGPCTRPIPSWARPSVPFNHESAARRPPWPSPTRSSSSPTTSSLTRPCTTRSTTGEPTLTWRHAGAATRCAR
jgi:hypothetical protein